MKNILVLISFLFSVASFAQAPADSVKSAKPDSALKVKPWKFTGLAGMNLTQATFTNWAAGGQNSISGQFYLQFGIGYKKGTTTWDNAFDLAYGLLAQGSPAVLKKTDDKIDFTSKYSQLAFKKYWYYSALVNFKSQFAPGYNYVNDTTRTLISDIMSPAYTLVAVGLDYKPNAEFSAFVSPFTGKFTFVMNQSLADQGAFGVEKAVTDSAGNVITPGKTFRGEFGGYMRFRYKAEVMKNVNVDARLELFNNYIDRPQNIDVNAEVMVLMKVNKFITASINMKGIYDNDVNVPVDRNKDGVTDGIGPRFQFSQMIGVGLAVSML